MGPAASPRALGRAGALATLLLPLGGCAGDAALPADAGSDLESLPAWSLVEELRIGSLDDPDRGFSRVGAVDVDADGSLYVFESQDREIRVYSPEGELVRRIGRSGQGPGEFGSAAVSFGIVGDTLWSVDAAARRLTRFTRGGELLSTDPLPVLEQEMHSTAVRRTIIPAFRATDGSFIGDMGMSGLSIRMNDLAAPALDTVHVPWVRFDARGAVVDTIGSYPLPNVDTEPVFVDVGRSRYRVPSPQDLTSLSVNTARGRLAIEQTAPADETGSIIRVSLTGFGGETVAARELTFRPAPYPDILLDTLARRAASGVGRVSFLGADGLTRIERFAEDSAAARPRIRDAMQVPTYQVPIQRVHAGSDGGFWLRREETGAETFIWIVLDPELRPVGRVEMPKNVRIAWSTTDRVWVVETDPLGIPWLVRYGVRPTNRSARLKGSAVAAGSPPTPASASGPAGSRAGRGTWPRSGVRSSRRPT